MWIWRNEQSAYQPWTTADTRDWEVHYGRADGIMVSLWIYNAKTGPDGSTSYLTPKFDVPESALVAVVTAAEVRTLVE